MERLLRAARRPVLVVSQEAGPAQAAYERLLVAVDFSGASRNLIAAAFAFGKSAQVELFHAISTANEGKLRYAEVSDQAIKAYRQECRRYARDRMFRMQRTAGGLARNAKRAARSGKRPSACPSYSECALGILTPPTPDVRGRPRLTGDMQ